MLRKQRLQFLTLWLLLAISLPFIGPTIFLETSNNTIKHDLKYLLEQIGAERDYNTIAFCQTKAKDCVFENLLPQLGLPLVVINKRLEYQYNEQFSTELLILLCLEQHEDINTAWTNFNVFRGLKRTRLLVYVPHETNMELIGQYCLDAMGNDLYNVLLIHKDFSETHVYYTCKKYPVDAPTYRRKRLHSGHIIFEQQFSNMYGAKLLTYPDQLEPRTMLYYAADGTIQTEGYVARFLKVFAAKVNATWKIELPIEIGKTVFYQLLLDLVRNNTVDVAASLIYPFSKEDFEVITYPVQLIDYCYMVPLPATMPINELFIGIINIPALLSIFLFVTIFAALLTHISAGTRFNFINLFLNDQAIRGMLGQSFVMPVQPSFKLKFVIFLLCCMSILTNTTYQAHFQSFLTSPPFLPIPRTYEDIEKAGLKILFSKHELEMLHSNHGLAKYKHLFLIVTDYDIWLRKRSYMNTKFIYPVSNVRWDVFDFQQTFFDRPIFYFNQDLCFFRSAFLCLPTRLDLPFRDLLEDFTLRMHSSGILKEWISLNFFVMVKLKRVEFRDLSEPLHFGRPLTVDDFLWIFVHYIGSMALGFVAFVGEILYYRWKNKRQTEKGSKPIKFCQ